MNGITALIDTSYEKLLCFLKRGYNPNLTDEYGLNLLMYLVKYNRNLKTIGILIDYGADINHKDNNGNGLIDYVFNENKTDNLELLKFLKSRGLCVNSSLLIYFSIQYKRYSLLKYLVKNSNINITHFTQLLKGDGFNLDNKCCIKINKKMIKWHYLRYATYLRQYFCEDLVKYVYKFM